MPTRARMTWRLPIREEGFFSFRRWLKARDPNAALRHQHIGDGLWLHKITVSKGYLASAAGRNWSAR